MELEPRQSELTVYSGDKTKAGCVVSYWEPRCWTGHGAEDGAGRHRGLYEDDSSLGVRGAPEYAFTGPPD